MAFAPRMVGQEPAESNSSQFKPVGLDRTGSALALKMVGQEPAEPNSPLFETGREVIRLVRSGPAFALKT